MNYLLISSIYLTFFIFLPLLLAETFNYDNPNEWSRNFSTCRGMRQSPISLSTFKAIKMKMTPILFGHYDEYLQQPVTIRNNGQTIEFEVPRTFDGYHKPFITGGGLMKNIYEVETVHFHWGSKNQKGSEHLINGKKYDLEMHIVHKNSKYKTMSSARNYKDGLAVVAVLFKLVFTLPNANYSALNEIYNSLQYIRNFNSTYFIRQHVTLGSLLGNIDREHYFTYAGSLTTPPCSEAVTWIVFLQVIPISYLELRKFWLLLDERGQYLRNNFRPIQSKERRKIFYQNSKNN